MTTLRFSLCTLLLTFGVFPLTAAEPPATLPTQMTTRGKVLFCDDLAQPLAKAWLTPKGAWEIVDGVLKGAEKSEDKHGAVARYPLAFDDAVIQFSFKLDGAKQISLSINKAKGHLCRLRLTPTGFTVQKDDQDGKNGPDKGVVLQTRPVTISPGEWHTVVLELRGEEMLASLDGTAVAFGAHKSLTTPKANIGLTVAGESVCFKDLCVWEALPNPTWAETRAKLQK